MREHLFTAEKYDFPASLGPRVTYVVCSIQRSGSNYLATLLRSTGNAGFPVEYADQQALEDFAHRAGTDDFPAILDFICRHRTSPNGVFGLKAHWYQFVELGQKIDIRRRFPSIRFIHLHRRDILGQAVSNARALQTWRWTNTLADRTEPQFDAKLIDDCVTEILVNESNWRLYFARRDLPFFDIAYEDLVANPAGILAEIGTFLGIDEKLALGEGDFVTERQGDSLNEAWRSEFLAWYSKQPFPQTEEHSKRIATRVLRRLRYLSRTVQMRARLLAPTNARPVASIRGAGGSSNSAKRPSP